MVAIDHGVAMETPSSIAGWRDDEPQRRFAAAALNSKAGVVTEDELLAFVRSAMGSVWTIELLVLLQRNPSKAWPTKALVTDLRASGRVVADSLATLENAGLVSVDDDGLYRYRPVSHNISHTVRELVDLYGRKPMTVVNTILSSPTAKIQTFADAFRFRK